MKYQVLENNKPCDCKHFPVDKSWEKSTYDSLDEARDYLNNWLGLFGPVSEDFKPGDECDLYDSVCTIKELA